MDGIKDRAQGKVKELKGKLTGDEATEIEGRAQQEKGEITDKAGRAKRKIQGKAEELKGRARQKTA